MIDIKDGSEDATAIMVESMKEEIAKLRKFISDRSKVDQKVFWDSVENKYPQSGPCNYTDSWARQNERRCAMWAGIEIACRVFSVDDDQFAWNEGDDEHS